MCLHTDIFMYAVVPSEAEQRFYRTPVTESVSSVVSLNYSPKRKQGYILARCGAFYSTPRYYAQLQTKALVDRYKSHSNHCNNTTNIKKKKKNNNNSCFSRHTHFSYIHIYTIRDSHEADGKHIEQPGRLVKKEGRKKKVDR